ncbi:MAG: response regulator [Candidatus Omnitrophica bacterium]|nr:response regulator [Candidatus Omnitrophota bacterium]
MTSMHVLLIEDNIIETKVMTAILSKADNPSIHFRAAASLNEGLEQLKDFSADLILLDLTLPDSEGIETFLKAQQEAPDIAIIVLTGLDDETVALEALRHGAQDYLIKGQTEPRMLLRIMNYACERKKIELKLKDTLKSLKKSNEKLKETRLQLIQAAKLEVVGRLAAGVAHEVKNPLAMLRMGVDYFKERGMDNDKDTFMLQSMVDAIRRADMVIKEMLDFSSLQELQIKSENLGKVIERSLLLIQHELTKAQVRLVRKFSPELQEVKIDRNRFEQVLINLCTNAVHAMTGDGTLTIETEKQILDKPGGIVGSRTNDIFAVGDEIAVIRIKDTGPGIPEELIDKIFDPFFTTKRDDGGTGLGLSIVKSIIQLHNGYIKIENNKEAKGACMTIMLRLA